MILKNITQIYKNQKVLNISNLNINESNITGLLGSNGSGKSTLLRILSHIENPVSGEIKSNLDKKDISILLPEPMLLKRSVKQNFIFALKAYDDIKDSYDERISMALSMVGLDFSFLNKKHYELSSGQTTRLVFAILIATRRKFMLLDEPTNSIDLMSSKLFAKSIKTLNKDYGCGFVIASHDEKWLSEICDENVFLYKGSVSKFELKNIFNCENFLINFGSNLNITLPNDFKNASKVALNPAKIIITKDDLSYEGFLHSLSIISNKRFLIKIKFGDYLLKTVVKIQDFPNLKVGDKINFYIDKSGFLALE